MLEVTCKQCGVAFCAQRKSAQFCDATCRKAHSRNGIPVNRNTSREQKRREDEFFDQHMRMCEVYYGLAPKERPAYLLGLIDKARQGDTQLRRILTNYVLLRNTEIMPRVIHWRGSKNYPTIAQEAHAFCKWHFDAGIAYVLDHPELEFLPGTQLHSFAMRKGDFERSMRRLQKKVLPGLADRSKQVTKAVIYMISKTHGASLHTEHGIRQEMYL